MGISGYSHAWRAVVACVGHGLVRAGGRPQRRRMDPTASLEPAGRSADRSGFSPRPLSYGGLREKWLGVRAQLDDERVQLALCDGDRDRCASGALQFLSPSWTTQEHATGARAWARSSRDQPVESGRWSDMAQHGAIDVWSSRWPRSAPAPVIAKTTRIAKFVALQAGRHLAR